MKRILGLVFILVSGFAPSSAAFGMNRDNPVSVIPGSFSQTTTFRLPADSSFKSDFQNLNEAWENFNSHIVAKILTPPTDTIRVGQIVSINGIVYLVGKDGLYTFPDLATFNSWGYSFSQVVPANDVEKTLPVLGQVPSRQPGCNYPLNQIAGNCP